uniref:energy-coupling factor ABC transporter permease n=1 Tax=Thaumasiovibrio occultus TaxID=1891184 RepID=UPI000B34B20D|nr:energy-coupling factor ABC transporter permease [Thaumasiovibrio occultus]
MLYVGWLIWGLCLTVFFPKEWWPKLRREPAYQHQVFATILIVLALWHLRAGVVDGLAIHFLGITTLALCHGWRIAMWMAVIPVLSTAVLGYVPWSQLGWHAILFSVLPAWLSYQVGYWVWRLMARHFFVYLFFGVFFNAALVMVITMVGNSALHHWLVGGSWALIWDNYLVLLPILLFPEALLNGMAMTLLVVYRPHWVRTFSEREYFS